MFINVEMQKRPLFKMCWSLQPATVQMCRISSYMQKNKSPFTFTSIIEAQIMEMPSLEGKNRKIEVLTLR